MIGHVAETLFWPLAPWHWPPAFPRSICLSLSRSIWISIVPVHKGSVQWHLSHPIATTHEMVGEKCWLRIDYSTEQADLQYLLRDTCQYYPTLSPTASNPPFCMTWKAIVDGYLPTTALLACRTTWQVGQRSIIPDMHWQINLIQHQQPSEIVGPHHGVLLSWVLKVSSCLAARLDMEYGYTIIPHRHCIVAAGLHQRSKR